MPLAHAFTTEQLRDLEDLVGAVRAAQAEIAGDRTTNPIEDWAAGVKLPSVEGVCSGSTIKVR